MFANFDACLSFLSMGAIHSNPKKVRLCVEPIYLSSTNRSPNSEVIRLDESVNF